MRNGELEGGELLFQVPTPPSPTHQTTQTPKSPIMGVMPMQPMPANVMSPDDMLRAYAERRAMGSAVTGAPAVPAPTANYNGTGMRTLYSPDHAARHGHATMICIAPGAFDLTNNPRYFSAIMA